MAARERSSIFLAAAVVVHVAVVLLLPHTRGERGPQSRHEETAWIDTIEGDRIAEGHAQAFSMLTTHEPTTRGHAGGILPKAPGADATRDPEWGIEAQSDPTGSSSLFLNQDIGLGGPSSYRVEIAKQRLDEHALANEAANHVIMDPIHAHEIMNGDYASGPVVAQIEHSTREVPSAPTEGRALLAVKVDELGLVVSVGVADASTDRRDWTDVATHVMNALAQKRLRLPQGSKGVSMRIEVTSKIALPSGSGTPIHVGSPAVDAISKMVKGEFDKAPDNGMGTIPIVGGGFDLSDIGAHKMRMVAAHVVSATVD